VSGPEVASRALNSTGRRGIADHDSMIPPNTMLIIADERHVPHDLRHTLPIPPP